MCMKVILGIRTDWYVDTILVYIIMCCILLWIKIYLIWGLFNHIDIISYYQTKTKFGTKSLRVASLIFSYCIVLTSSSVSLELFIRQECFSLKFGPLEHEGRAFCLHTISDSPTSLHHRSQSLKMLLNQPK